MKILCLPLICLSVVASAQVKVYGVEKAPPKATASLKAIVNIRSLSEVTGPRFTLGDVAEISASEDLKARLEQIDMGMAPVAGIPRPIVASRVQGLLLTSGLKAKDFEIRVSQDAKVALKVQKIELELFVQAAKQAAEPLVGPQVTMQNSQSFPDFLAPLGNVQFTTGKPSKNQRGFTVLVTVVVDGKRVNSRNIQLDVDASSTASIKSGDAVRIFLKSAGATIELIGRARSGGYVGQSITVVSSTGSVHQGTVLSTSEVEVKL